MGKYLEDHLHTGSAKPEKPVSKRTDGPATGNPGSYSPSAAASHLKGQDSCAPKNNGPTKMGGYE